MKSRNATVAARPVQKIFVKPWSITVRCSTNYWKNQSPKEREHDMNYPLRNDPPEELTTADLARGKRPAKVEEMKSQSGLANSVLSNTEPVQDIPADMSAQRPGREGIQTEGTAQLFPNNQ